jgi:hypothetical protein
MTHEYEQRDGLYRVGESAADAALNVVFVHGLGGGAHSTWTSGNPGSIGFWPAAIARDNPRCAVWTLQYTARVLEWNPFAHSRSIDLLDRAVWFVQSLVEKQIPARPTVFVAHSLGGVLVKQALQFAESLGPPQWRGVWNQTKAVVFLATPHVGAGIASVGMQVAEALQGATLLSRLVLRPSPALANLEKNNPTLRYLTDWYRDRAPAQGIETGAFAEGRPLKGLVKVVDESSASPQVANCTVVPLADDDHISIAKPTHRDHLVYSRVSTLLGELTAAASSGLATSALAWPRPDKIVLARQEETQRLIARLCGDWWERENVGGAISLFRIERDPVFNSVFLGGKSYDADGNHAATWRSVMARVDLIDGKVVLQYVWKGEHTDPKVANVPFHGLGIMDFDDPAVAGAVIARGAGRFWNVDEFHPEKTRLKPIKLRRVSEEGAARVLAAGKKSEITAFIAKMLDPENW